MTAPVRAVRPPRAAGPAASSAGAGDGRAAGIPPSAALPAGTQLFVNHRLALRFERRRRLFLTRLAKVTGANR